MGKAKQLKKLRRASENLPVTLQDTRRGMSGAEILAKQPGATLLDGTPIVVNARYMVNTKIKVNHNRAMKKQFLKGGLQAASDYYNAVIEGSIKKVEPQPE